MAYVVCCPCGTPIDFERLELVISLTCPKCNRELDLEVDRGPTQRLRAVLTVLEGPHWVGERFVLPVGVELRIGQGSENWISLEDENVSQVHCRLLLHSAGAVVVEDQKSKTGTWIGEQRIAKGKLGPKQTLRVGAFKLRLDYQSLQGSTIVTSQSDSYQDLSGILPTMKKVGAQRTKTGAMVVNRYRIARWLIICTAWASALHATMNLHAEPHLAWRWANAIVAGLIIGSVLTGLGRRVTLAHPMLKYVPLAFLVILAVTEIVWRLPAAGIANIFVAGGLSLVLIQSSPSAMMAMTGFILGGLGALVVLISAIVSLAGAAR